MDEINLPPIAFWLFISIGIAIIIGIADYLDWREEKKQIRKTIETSYQRINRKYPR